MSLRVDYDERAIDQAAAFLDDPHGMRGPGRDRPAGRLSPHGRVLSVRSPNLRRLRVGRYRILYEITEDAIAVRHIARSTGS